MTEFPWTVAHMICRDDVVRWYGCRHGAKPGSLDVLRYPDGLDRFWPTESEAQAAVNEANAKITKT